MSASDSPKRDWAADPRPGGWQRAVLTDRVPAQPQRYWRYKTLPSLIGIPLFRNLNDTTLSETLALLNYKVVTILRMTQQTAGTESFEIPYTHEQLAAYLNVARPALSAEIRTSRGTVPGRI